MIDLPDDVAERKLKAEAALATLNHQAKDKIHQAILAHNDTLRLTLHNALNELHTARVMCSRTSTMEGLDDIRLEYVRLFGVIHPTASTTKKGGAK